MGVILALLACASPVAADVVLPPAIAGSPRLKDLRRSMLAGSDLSDRQMQTLADAGEGLAAARYAKRLEERQDPAFVDDAAHYYSIAVYMGRDFAVPRLLATLKNTSAEFGPARLRNIRGVLDRAARKGDAAAAAGLGDLLIEGKPFGKDIPIGRDLLMIAAQAGDFKAALRLALQLMEGSPGFPPDPDAARHALDLAMASPDPGVKAMVLTLQKQLESSPPPDLAPEPAPAPAVLTEASTEADEIEVLGTSSASFPPRPRPRPDVLEGSTP